MQVSCTACAGKYSIMHWHIRPDWPSDHLITVPGKLHVPSSMHERPHWTQLANCLFLYQWVYDHSNSWSNIFHYTFHKSDKSNSIRPSILHMLKNIFKKCCNQIVLWTFHKTWQKYQYIYFVNCSFSMNQ